MASVTRDDAAVRKIAAGTSDRLWSDQGRTTRLWTEIAETLYPIALPGLKSRVSGMLRSAGTRREPIRATNWPQEQLKKGAAGFSVHLTSPARKWFELTTARPLADMTQEHELDESLELLTDAVREVFSASGIYQELDKLYEHLMAFGTACLLLLPNPRALGYNLIKATTLRFGTYALGIGADGQVNRVSRKFEFTANQLCEEFGRARLPETVLRSVREGRGADSRFVVTNLIEPNRVGDVWDDCAEACGLPQEMTYRSIYLPDWSEPGFELLDVRGIPCNPIIAPRMEKEAGDVWGRGRGVDALPLARALAALREDAINITGNISDPALFVDTSLQGQPLRLERGGITYYPMAEGRQPTIPAIPVNQSLQGITELTQDVRNELAETLLVTRFAVIDALKANPGVKTATEVQQLVRENLGLLGPIVTGLDSELLDPLVGTVAQLTILAAQDEGIDLSKMAPVLDTGMKIVYVGEIHQALKAGNISALTNLAQFVAGLMQATQDPSVADNLRKDEAVREFADAVGANKRTLSSPEEMAQTRKARAQQAQQTAALAMAREGAGAAKDGASAISTLRAMQETGGQG